ncbi:hypothetical protein Q31a_59860 [Aureliella helgolandensis]|uniref:Uncharacterized protein n=1 Tax=Aureliella helgolandensis TaxID=2527968 RepID=A0A518GG71_9BACT|nr:hypothetical protein Q31a_59860 [Aureliella helgolandensis]
MAAVYCSYKSTANVTHHPAASARDAGQAEPRHYAPSNFVPGAPKALLRAEDSHHSGGTLGYRGVLRIALDAVAGAL